ncbi:MAG: DUF1656 domain-containing protein [Desulfofustis sp. PB-SRB1]|mgnify:CR=1 FL=1|jgi:hypothetical protein|nr:DUF1656 domain-containing protein [Desulfofustis sp. PB-SRB1]MBM1002783.1 DUF1656 domain-containing protein [Desulfofustis sp. PB-SRB1]HBH30415.1 DUF1656 domain-containing protein [Desulfofustis sp.]
MALLGTFRELSIGGVYLSPWLLIAIITILLSWLLADILNRLRWSRFFASPALVFLAMMAVNFVLLEFLLFGGYR